MAMQIPSPAEPLAGAAVAGKRWYDFLADLFRMATETKETAGSRMPWSGTKTIASGAITITQPGHVTIDTESAAASDDLDTITYSGAQTGDLLILSAANSSRTVVVKDATGNIHTSGDFSLDHSRDTIMLIYTSSVWCEVARSNNST